MGHKKTHSHKRKNSATGSDGGSNSEETKLIRENGREYPIDSGVASFEKVAGYEDAWNLLVNGQYSSHITVGDPTRLAFPYMQWIAASIAWFARSTGVSPRRITHLGGVGCSLARYVSARYPESRNTVVEIDAKLAELARALCDVPRAPQVKIRVGEARAVTESFRPSSRDIVIRDVFSADFTPRILTTLEFANAVHRSLAEPGLYVVNCGVRGALETAKREAVTLREAFPHVGLIADHTVLKGKRGGNIIFVASSAELPVRDSQEATALTADVMRGTVPAMYKDAAWVEDFCAGAQVLTDPPTGQNESAPAARPDHTPER